MACISLQHFFNYFNIFLLLSTFFILFSRERVQSGIKIKPKGNIYSKARKLGRFASSQCWFWQAYLPSAPNGILHGPLGWALSVQRKKKNDPFNFCFVTKKKKKKSPPRTKK